MRKLKSSKSSDTICVQMRPSGPEEEVYCQNCGRYIGSLGRCPYCRTKSDKRLSYKLLKWGGLALAVFGVLGIYVYALGFMGPPPSMHLADVNPTNNFAIVTFENITVTGARYDTSTRWLSIFVDNTEDNVGSMFIRAYDSETEKLIERNNVPGPGQKVDIVTKLQTSEDFNMGVLQVAGGLDILETTPKKISISKLSSNPENYLYERVQVEGKVMDKSKDDPFEGTATVKLESVTTGNTLEVQFPYSAPWFKETLDENWSQISIGSTITVTGGVDLYYNSVQLSPGSWEDFQF